MLRVDDLLSDSTARVPVTNIYRWCNFGRKTVTDMEYHLLTQCFIVKLVPIVSKDVLDWIVCTDSQVGGFAIDRARHSKQSHPGNARLNGEVLLQKLELSIYRILRLCVVDDNFTAALCFRLREYIQRRCAGWVVPYQFRAPYQTNRLIPLHVPEKKIRTLPYIRQQL